MRTQLKRAVMDMHCAGVLPAYAVTLVFRLFNLKGE